MGSEVEMQILDGKAVAQNLLENIRRGVESFVAKHQRPPQLTVLLVGEDKASQVYVRNKQKACEAVGMASRLIHLPASTSQVELENQIHALNQDLAVDAVLVQLPLPKNLDGQRVLEMLSADKDADGFTFKSLGYFFAGRDFVKPCTPSGVMKILKHYRIPIEGKHAVVVGRSNIVGKPMAMMLLQAGATVTICHSKTQNLREHTSQADLVVVAAGVPHLLGKEDFKKGAVVIDVGIHGSGEAHGLRGDVRFDEIKGHVSACSPVPGGVGPMTIACLLENTLYLAEKAREN